MKKAPQPQPVSVLGKHGWALEGREAWGTVHASSSHSGISRPPPKQGKNWAGRGW